MTMEATYVSPEELFRRLHDTLSEGVADSTAAARRTRLGHDASNLVRVLAERIYDKPQEWNLTIESELWGEDLPHDLLLAILNRAGGIGFRSGGFDWVEKEVVRRTEIIKSMIAATDKSRKTSRKKTPSSKIQGQTSKAGLPSNVLPQNAANPWRHFEQNFPRDALLLRLRFLLNRTNEEIMTILEIPSAGALNARVRAAREGMRSYLREAGYDTRSVDETLKTFEEGS